jgi:[acyl-carrier-protein] S-malonyltransferase
LGLDLDTIEKLIKENSSTHGVCELANDNAPGQIVVSGHVKAVEAFVERAKTQGAKRAIILPVSAPFHCSLMQPAADSMKAELEKINITPPSLPIVCNVTAQTENNPNTLRHLLVEQITGRVRWRESVNFMARNGVTTLIELGSGKVLSGLTKRINSNIETMNASTPHEVDSLIKHLSNI